MLLLFDELLNTYIQFTFGCLRDDNAIFVSFFLLNQGLQTRIIQ